jgi:HSP90 family molecular chaperone
VKGVIDCEDLPLNISRENYQDSSLIVKLRSIITRKVLSELESEANKDPSTFTKWFLDFQFFLKEGVASDHENQD